VNGEQPGLANARRCPQCGCAFPLNQALCPKCALADALEIPSTAGEDIERSKAGVLRRFGDYELIEEIARGGMGIVYKARQLSLSRIVALKMILAGRVADKQFVQRFRTEAATAAILQHPNIVAVHEVGFHDGQHFFSMDYVEGQNLAQLVGQQPLGASKAARYLQLIAEAIHYAHQRNILHRDLKPSNVLIDSNDQPRITDFGLAKRLRPEAEVSTVATDITVSGQILGSPGFMPPEQAGALRGKVGRHSDIYALGGILYYLLTARAPFQGESLEATLHQVLNDEPISPHLLNPGVPRDLETICLKCLEKEPRRRYQTAEELSGELGRFLKDEPIRARPAGRPEKLWRWSRRNPVIAGLAVSVLMIGSIGLTGWLVARERGRVAEQAEKRRLEILYASDSFLAERALVDTNLINAGDFLRGLQAAIERRPTIAAFWRSKAIVLDRTGVPQDALTDFSKAIELASTNAEKRVLTDALLRRSELLRKLDRIG
jgi:eukaryotic-like serine/threonine-protein kinase